MNNIKSVGSVLIALAITVVSTVAHADPIVAAPKNVITFKADVITAKKPEAPKCRVVELQQGHGTVKVCN